MCRPKVKLLSINLGICHSMAVAVMDSVGFVIPHGMMLCNKQIFADSQGPCPIGRGLFSMGLRAHRRGAECVFATHSVRCDGRPKKIAMPIIGMAMVTLYLPPSPWGVGGSSPSINFRRVGWASKSSGFILVPLTHSDFGTPLPPLSFAWTGTPPGLCLGKIIPPRVQSLPFIVFPGRVNYMRGRQELRQVEFSVRDYSTGVFERND